jgi:hypothetical protein
MDVFRDFFGLEPAERKKRKREFQEILFQSVADGKLTEDEITEIARLKEEYGLREEDLRPVRVQVYAAALQVITKDRTVTEEEWTEMQRIQQFLGIPDDEVARDKKELLRLHILQEVHDGNLPIVPAPAGLALTKGETVHWREKGTLRDGAEEEGELCITDKRVIFRARAPVVIRVSKIVDVRIALDTVEIATAGMSYIFLPFERKHAKLIRLLLQKIIKSRSK